MSKFLDLGFGICIINVFYSTLYMMMWCVELQHFYENDVETYVWVALYAFNLCLNVFLFLGLRKRDRLAIIMWFSLTLLWFVPELYGHKRGCRLNRRGPVYHTINIIFEGYVILSFGVMLLVYIYLARPIKRVVPRSRVSHTEHAQHDDVMELQMVELIDSKGKSGNVEQSTSGEKQQVLNIDLHRAEIDGNN